MSGYFSVLRDEIEPLLPPDPAWCLDVGCGTGVTTKWLKTLRPRVKTVGVEVEPSAAALAASELDAVHLLDLDRGLGELTQYRGRIDLLLLLDVLEHLEDPWSRLRDLKDLLSTDGVVIASLPNVRNLKVLWPLLVRGEWRYESAGILDKTHLRFFTRKTALELFGGAGFRVDATLSTGPLHKDRIKSLGGGLAYAANRMLGGALQDLVAHQFLLRAVIRQPGDGSGSL